MSSRLFTAFLLCAAGFILLTSQQLPPMVASHFGGSGAADGFMPLRVYISVMLVVLVGLPAAIAGLVSWSLSSPKARINLPNKAYWLAPERRAETVRQLRSGFLWFVTFLVAFLCYTHWLVVHANGQQPPVLQNSWFIGGLASFLVAVLVWLKVFLGSFRRSA